MAAACACYTAAGGERDKARVAATAARRTVERDADKLRRLDELVKNWDWKADDGDDPPAATRSSLIAVSLGVLALALGLVLSAMRDSIVFFNSPTDVLQKHVAAGARIRLGGLVSPGTLVRSDNMQVRFQVTDGNHTVTVAYQGCCPIYSVKARAW